MRATVDVLGFVKEWWLAQQPTALSRQVHLLQQLGVARVLTQILD
jgi:hypothetical protein